MTKKFLRKNLKKGLRKKYQKFQKRRVMNKSRGAQSRLTGLSVNRKPVNRFFGLEKMRTVNRTEITG